MKQRHKETKKKRTKTNKQTNEQTNKRTNEQTNTHTLEKCLPKDQDADEKKSNHIHYFEELSKRNLKMILPQYGKKQDHGVEKKVRIRKKRNSRKKTVLFLKL